MVSTCDTVHESKFTDRTNEMWVPRLRWIPEQSMQMKMPSLLDAQRGCLEGQSAQTLLSGWRNITSRRFLIPSGESLFLRLAIVTRAFQLLFLE